MRQVKRYEAKDGTVTYQVRFRDASKRGTSETFTDPDTAADFAKLLDLIGPTAAVQQIFAEKKTGPTITLNEVAADHFKYQTGIEEGTRLDYQRIWKRTWGPLLGALPVSSDIIDKDKVSEAVLDLEKRYSPKSMENHRGLLSGVVKRAMEKGLLTTNPVKGVKLSDVTIDPDAADDEMTLLTMQQFDVLSQQFTGVYYNLVRFLVGTGARWGEATVVRKKDFDFTGANPVVRIRRAVKRSGDGAIVIRGPKTKKSRRTIMLPRHLVPELEALMEGKKADDLVFVGPRGGQILHRNFWSGIWRPAIWRAQRCTDHYEAGCRCGGSRPKLCKLHPGLELPEPCGCDGTLGFWVRIHDLRHTHASWLLGAGIPIHVVSRRLGHESIQTTVDTYGHLLPDAQMAAAKAADVAFDQMSKEAVEAEIERALIGLNYLLEFLTGKKDMPPEIEQALRANGWRHVNDGALAIGGGPQAIEA